MLLYLSYEVSYKFKRKHWLQSCIPKRTKRVDTRLASPCL